MNAEEKPSPPGGWLRYSDGSWAAVNEYGIPSEPFVPEFVPDVTDGLATVLVFPMAAIEVDE